MHRTPSNAPTPRWGAAALAPVRRVVAAPLTVLLVVGAGCGGDGTGPQPPPVVVPPPPPPPPPPPRVEVAPSEVVLRRGEFEQLVATVNGARVTTVTFEALDPVVTVDSSGLVRGVTPGIGSIRYAVSGATAEPVTGVIPVLVRGILIGADTLALVVGNQVRLRAIVVLAADRADTAVTWRSSDSTIASVASDGTVRALAPGSVQLVSVSVADTLLLRTIEVVVSGLPGSLRASRGTQLDGDPVGERDVATRLRIADRRRPVAARPPPRRRATSSHHPADSHDDRPPPAHEEHA